MAEYTHVTHLFEPIYDETSQVLILGTFPSVKSREQNFYYGHPQNRFWRVLAAVCGCAVPGTVEEKKAMLLREHIAVWDVIASCDITGSSDASIRNVQVNDIGCILSRVPDIRIFTNGAKAHELYRKYMQKTAGREAVRLLSTSPANAACGFEKLCGEWKVIRSGKTE
ncbi:MAG: DNA-deoxyinosine glycosylase [Lachnospiraceae bacterium]|nr:DNA-deoxyinosine glycosylase [Lachnospiraceae bacterium]